MDSQERFENMVGLVEAHQYEWAIWQAAEREQFIQGYREAMRDAVKICRGIQRQLDDDREPEGA